MGRVDLRTVDNLSLAILPVYLAVTILIGLISRQRHSRANDFLNSTRSLPVWIVSIAFLSANTGALEIVGLSAFAAQYRVQAFHFYWIGAIPGMVFLSAFTIPIYMRSGARSLPEYLEARFDSRLRRINGGLILAIHAVLSGICIYAMAQVLEAVFGWPFAQSAALTAGAVLIYVCLGGLKATIYNEVFRLLVIASGLLPLLRTCGGTCGLTHGGNSHAHLRLDLPLHSRTSMIEAIGVAIGLGFVLSFSYWCIDFVLIQRTLTAKSIEGGRMVPLLAGFGKLGFSFLVWSQH